jgi:hypothetical protein
MKLSKERLQSIRAYFAKHGIVVELRLVSRGVQIQFCPRPQYGWIDNCVVIGPSGCLDNGRETWSVFPHFTPMPIVDAIKVKGFSVSGMRSALEKARQLRAEHPL